MWKKVLRHSTLQNLIRAAYQKGHEDGYVKGLNDRRVTYLRPNSNQFFFKWNGLKTKGQCSHRVLAFSASLVQFLCFPRSPVLLLTDHNAVDTIANIDKELEAHDPRYGAVIAMSLLSYGLRSG